MLGKLSSFLSYFKVLEVYVIKRFPSNKAPLFGMIVTYMGVYFIFTRMWLNFQTRKLQMLRAKQNGDSLQLCELWQLCQPWPLRLLMKQWHSYRSMDSWILSHYKYEDYNNIKNAIKSFLPLNKKE
jgi:hypothetical protein